MHIPVIVGMYCSGKPSVTETASDAGVERSLSRRSPKKGTEPVLPKYGAKRYQPPKACPVTKPLAVVNGATFVLRTAA
jgi:hypothetical protein